MAYIGNTPAEKYQTLNKQTFSVSATTGYTLSSAVTNPQEIALFINNVRQNPNSSYSVSGTALTLSAATASGDTMYCVFLGKSVGTIGVADNAITLAKMASGTDGNLISYDASGNPVAVATGNDGQVLTSTGAGSPPVFETLAASGITMVNMWHRPSNFSLSANTYTTVTGLQKLSITGAGNFGSDMTESSGIFTFPSTGIYKVEFMFNIFGGGGLYSGARLQTTVDNSTYVTVSEGYNNQYTTDAGSFGVIPYHFDVTNTTTHKVKFLAVAQSSSNLGGGSNLLYSGAIFTRLGDT